MYPEGKIQLCPIKTPKNALKKAHGCTRCFWIDRAQTTNLNPLHFNSLRLAHRHKSIETKLRQLNLFQSWNKRLQRRFGYSRVRVEKKMRKSDRILLGWIQAKLEDLERQIQKNADCLLKECAKAKYYR